MNAFTLRPGFKSAGQDTCNMSYKIFVFAVLLFFLGSGGICAAQDVRADILKELEESINKIEDIQCELDIIQTGKYNPELIKYRIDTVKVLEKLGTISSEEAREKIASITRGIESAKEDFTFVHPTAKWKMKKSEGLFNLVSKDSVLNFDGSRKTSYASAMKRGRIDDEIEIPSENPYFVLTINKMSIVEFFRIAQENNDLTVSTKDDLIEITGMVLDSKPGPGFPANCLKVLIDPEKGYLPVHCEFGIKFGDPDVDQEVDMYLIKGIFKDIQLEELEGNIWFPVSWNIVNYDFINVPDINIPPDEWELISFPSHFKIKFALSEVKINQGLGQEDFKFEFPDGTNVYRKRPTRLLYIIGALVMLILIVIIAVYNISLYKEKKSAGK